MTLAVFSQRALVAASLQLAPSRADRHGTYPLRKLVRGTNAEPAPASVESPSRVQARRPEETGSDGWGAASTRPCPNPRCVDGEVFWRHDPFDPQTEDSEECRTCGGAGEVPIPRQIVGTRRAA